MVYGPEFLLDNEIIVVTLNYRLGALGFLYAGPDSGAPGNAGLRDQALALRWVRDNIRGFGGDPGAVTLWGESTGAVSAHMHTLAGPAGQEVTFHRMILSSGSALLPWAVREHPEEALQAARKLAGALGWRARPCGPAGRADERDDLVSFLRKVPAEAIVAADNALKSMSGHAGNGMRLLEWLPTVEDPRAEPGAQRFLPRSPAVALAEGTFRSVPTMMGVNSREGLVWLAGKSPWAVRRLLRRVDCDFRLVLDDLPFVHAGGLSDLQRYRAARLVRSFFFGRQRVTVRTLPAFLDLYSDLIFNIGMLETAALQQRMSLAPMFLYRVSYDGVLGSLKRLTGTNIPGVSHADELGYLFDVKVLPHVPLTKDSSEIRTRRWLLKLWTNFIKHGNPTPGRDEDFATITWGPTSIEPKTYLDIDEKLSIRTHMFEPRMRFWKDLYRNVIGRPLSW